jgi:hypothetical protein
MESSAVVIIRSSENWLVQANTVPIPFGNKISSLKSDSLNKIDIFGA